MLEVIFLVVACYIVTILIGGVDIILSRRRAEEIKAEPAQLSPVIGESKSEMLSPPPSKAHPAQVPEAEVESLFKSNTPLRAEFATESPDIEAEQTHPQCIDYMDMEAIVHRMVHGTLQPEDIPLLKQMEGSDIYAQIESVMSAENLELKQKLMKR